jgi:CheY-like chemotaxis protein
MTVILLTGDLTVISRVEGAAARAGASTSAVSSETAAIECCQSNDAKLLIVDLNAASLDVKSLLTQLKMAMAAPPRVVAFGPHVHEERLAAAREAGCDEVVSRGQFFAQLESIVGRGLSG